MYLIKTKMFDEKELITSVCNSEQEAKFELEKIKQLFKNKEHRIEKLI